MAVIKFPQIRVAPLSEASIAEASQLLCDCWHETYANHLPQQTIEQHDETHFSVYLAKKQPRCWLAWYDDELVGVMVLSLNCIDELCVKPQYRRKKIGRRLMDVAINDCNSRHYRGMQVGIEEFNDSSLRFFESQGWHEVGSEYVSIEANQGVKALVYGRSCNSRPGAAL